MQRPLKHRVLATTAFAITVAATGLASPGVAHAKKPGVLEGKNMVIDKIELRKLRFSITPQIGMSLSQPFVHKGMVGGVLRFDITDWIGIRASVMYGAINIKRKLLNDTEATLPRRYEDGAVIENPDGSTETVDCGAYAACRRVGDLFNPAPLREDFQAGLTKLNLTASADVAFTPFSGKLGLFKAIFTEYDIYVFGGVGFSHWNRMYPDARTTNDINGITGDSANPDDDSKPAGADRYCAPGGAAQSEECLLHPVLADDKGIRIGPSFGAGLHLFITDWVSINLEVHDIMAQQNIVGLNATIEEVPTVKNAAGSGSDRVWVHNTTLGLGATFYFPPKAKREKSVMQQQRKRSGKKKKG